MPDGRQLGYLIVGEGKPIFYFHGVPTSRLDVLHLKEYATSRNLQIIGVDRPGFGLSTYSPRTNLRDFGADVNYLIDSLGIDKFTLIGYSSGGPCVMTYLTVFPERVTQGVIISSPSLPLNYDEILSTGVERLLIKLASTIRSVGIWYLKQERAQWLTFANNPLAFLESKQGQTLLDNTSEDDARLMNTEHFRTRVLRSVVEFYRQGDDGIQALYEERLLTSKKWDVDLTQIPPGLVSVVHGRDDQRIPVENAYRNVEAIPGARLVIVEEKGHSFWLNDPELLDGILR